MPQEQERKNLESIKKTTPLPEVKHSVKITPTYRPVVYYFPSGNGGFGHISMSLNPENDLDYIAYGSSKLNSLETEKTNYETPFPIEIPLPECSAEKCREIRDKWTDREEKSEHAWNSKKYSLFFHNCSHATLNTIQTLELLGLSKNRAWDTVVKNRNNTRPYSVARLANEIALANNEKIRNEILNNLKNNKGSVLFNIEKLILNDIDRLENEIIQEETSHLAIDIEVKQKKIERLRSLINLIEHAPHGFKAQLNRVSKTIGGRTEDLLRICENYIPQGQLNENLIKAYQVEKLKEIALKEYARILLTLGKEESKNKKLIELVHNECNQVIDKYILDGNIKDYEITVDSIYQKYGNLKTLLDLKNSVLSLEKQNKIYKSEIDKINNRYEELIDHCINNTVENKSEQTYSVNKCIDSILSELKSLQSTISKNKNKFEGLINVINLYKPEFESFSDSNRAFIRNGDRLIASRLRFKKEKPTYDLANDFIKILQEKWKADSNKIIIKDQKLEEQKLLNPLYEHKNYIEVIDLIHEVLSIRAKYKQIKINKISVAKQANLENLERELKSFIQNNFPEKSMPEIYEGVIKLLRDENAKISKPGTLTKELIKPLIEKYEKLKEGKSVALENIEESKLDVKEIKEEFNKATKELIDNCLLEVERDSREKIRELKDLLLKQFQIDAKKEYKSNDELAKDCNDRRDHLDSLLTSVVDVFSLKRKFREKFKREIPEEYSKAFDEVEEGIKDIINNYCTYKDLATANHDIAVLLEKVCDRFPKVTDKEFFEFIKLLRERYYAESPQEVQKKEEAREAVLGTRKSIEFADYLEKIKEFDEGHNEGEQTIDAVRKRATDQSTTLADGLGRTFNPLLWEELAKSERLRLLSYFDLNTSQWFSDQLRDVFSEMLQQNQDLELEEKTEVSNQKLKPFIYNITRLAWDSMLDEKGKVKPEIAQLLDIDTSYIQRRFQSDLAKYKQEDREKQESLRKKWQINSSLAENFLKAKTEVERTEAKKLIVEADSKLDISSMEAECVLYQQSDQRKKEDIINDYNIDQSVFESSLEEKSSLKEDKNKEYIGEKAIAFHLFNAYMVYVTESFLVRCKLLNISDKDRDLYGLMNSSVNELIKKRDFPNNDPVDSISLSEISKINNYPPEITALVEKLKQKLQDQKVPKFQAEILFNFLRIAFQDSSNLDEEMPNGAIDLIKQYNTDSLTFSSLKKAIKRKSEEAIDFVVEYQVDNVIKRYSEKKSKFIEDAFSKLTEYSSKNPLSDLKDQLIAEFNKEVSLEITLIVRDKRNYNNDGTNKLDSSIEKNSSIAELNKRFTSIINTISDISSGYEAKVWWSISDVNKIVLGQIQEELCDFIKKQIENKAFSPQEINKKAAEILKEKIKDATITPKFRSFLDDCIESLRGKEEDLLLVDPIERELPAEQSLRERKYSSLEQTPSSLEQTAVRPDGANSERKRSSMFIPEPKKEPIDFIKEINNKRNTIMAALNTVSSPAAGASSSVIPGASSSSSSTPASCGWEIKDENSSKTIVKKGNNASSPPKIIKVDSKEISTQDSDKETFRAMIKAYMALSNTLPKLTTTDALRQTWVEVLREAGYYSDEIKIILQDSKNPEEKLRPNPALGPHNG